MSPGRYIRASAAILFALSSGAALAAPPRNFSLLSEQLRRHQLTELRVYSSLSLHGGGTLYEVVPNESYVVQHPKFTCTDGITETSAKELANWIEKTTFSAEHNRYAVDWVLQFYDANGVKRFSVLMGTGLGDFGKASDPWHVEMNGQSFVADGPIRRWISSNYPHPGCMGSDLLAPRPATHGK